MDDPNVKRYLKSPRVEERNVGALPWALGDHAAPGLELHEANVHTPSDTSQTGGEEA